VPEEEEGEDEVHGADVVFASQRTAFSTTRSVSACLKMP
jgi:hypothetical protein